MPVTTDSYRGYHIGRIRSRSTAHKSNSQFSKSAWSETSDSRTHVRLFFQLYVFSPVIVAKRAIRKFRRDVPAAASSRRHSAATDRARDTLNYLSRGAFFGNNDSLE